MIGKDAHARHAAHVGWAVASAALTALAAAYGCHTWQGVKEDTNKAVHETGNEMEKAGKKLKGTDEEKPANPQDDAAAPTSDR